MSAVIHIETNTIGANQFEFIQTWVSGENNLNERYLQEKHDDRMQAAIVNVGKACRWLQDANAVRGSVCITSDKDGRDARYGGEHDALFEAIYNKSEYVRNRAKYNLLYHSHVKHLDRIRELADANEISFTQDRSPFLNEVVFHGKELPATVKPEHHARNFWNEGNLVTLSLAGSQNRIKCNLCGVSSVVQRKDSFTAFSVFSFKSNRTVIIKNNKAFLKFFLNEHLNRHGLIENETITKPTRRYV